MQFCVLPLKCDASITNWYNTKGTKNVSHLGYLSYIDESKETA